MQSGGTRGCSGQGPSSAAPASSNDSGKDVQRTESGGVGIGANHAHPSGGPAGVGLGAAGALSAPPFQSGGTPRHEQEAANDPDGWNGLLQTNEALLSQAAVNMEKYNVQNNMIVLLQCQENLKRLMELTEAAHGDLNLPPLPVGIDAAVAERILPRDMPPKEIMSQSVVPIPGRPPGPWSVMPQPRPIPHTATAAVPGAMLGSWGPSMGGTNAMAPIIQQAPQFSSASLMSNLARVPSPIMPPQLIPWAGLPPEANARELAAAAMALQQASGQLQAAGQQQWMAQQAAMAAGQGLRPAAAGPVPSIMSQAAAANALMASRPPPQPNGMQYGAGVYLPRASMAAMRPYAPAAAPGDAAAAAAASAAPVLQGVGPVGMPWQPAVLAALQQLTPQMQQQQQRPAGPEPSMQGSAALPQAAPGHQPPPGGA